MVLYRDKLNPQYDKFSEVFVKSAKDFNFEKILIQNSIHLAKKLNVSIHFSSNNFHKIRDAKKENIFTVVSCHTEKEVNLAYELGADMVTLSPLFPSPNKGKTIPKELFKSICNSSKLPIIALGGITSKEKIDTAIQLGASGVASIRYFTLP